MPADQPQLILASSSVYRRLLLQRLGIPFSCVSPDVNESVLANEQPREYVSRLALSKAAAGAAGNTPRPALIIGSDQALVLDDQIISKPAHIDAAQAMLQACSGQTVIFHCGWSLLQVAADGGHEVVADAVLATEVAFRQLSAAEIKRYLQREPALDCAGAFKSEALGISLFAAIRSDDPTALIGLPLISICAGLRKAGLDLP